MTRRSVERCRFANWTIYFQRDVLQTVDFHFQFNDSGGAVRGGPHGRATRAPHTSTHRPRRTNEDTNDGQGGRPFVSVAERHLANCPTFPIRVQPNRPSRPRVSSPTYGPKIAV